MSAALEYAREHRATFLEELKGLLRIPSVSTSPEHRGDVRRTAELLALELERLGMENVEIVDVAVGDGPAGHPLVLADWLHAPGAPTVLCYGHYDVQPPDPLDEWLTTTLRAHGARRQPVRPWRRRRQGPDVHAPESARVAVPGQRAAASQRSRCARRRRGGGRRVDRCIPPQAPRTACRRLRPDLGHRDVCSGPADALRRPARA